HDVGLPLAMAKETEVALVAGDADDDRVDLEEAPLLALLGMAGKRPGTEPNHAVAALCLAEPLAHLGDGIGHRAAFIIVGRRRRIVDELSLRVPDALCAMQRGAMHQRVVFAVGRRLHAVDAKVAALGLPALYARG